MQHIIALRFKLQMFCAPIDGPSNVLYDNQSVVLNTSRLELPFNKKNNALPYHLIQWAVAVGIMRVERWIQIILLMHLQKD